MRKAIVKLLVFCLMFSLAQGAMHHRTKPGACPPPVSVEICSMTCRADDHCGGTKKCCRTSCGGSVCLRAVTARNPAILQEKPGVCPPLNPYDPWVCSSRCSVDSDCRGTKKCCRNRCGALACQKP